MYVFDMVNKFILLGFKDFGYMYVNIDDCWSIKSWDGFGNFVLDLSKWLNGIKVVVDQIYGMGFKFGLYGCVGIMICVGYLGLWGYEMQDVKFLVSWGIDFWKYDVCYIFCVNG